MRRAAGLKAALADWTYALFAFGLGSWHARHLVAHEEYFLGALHRACVQRPIEATRAGTMRAVQPRAAPRAGARSEESQDRALQGLRRAAHAPALRPHGHSDAKQLRGAVLHARHVRPPPAARARQHQAAAVRSPAALPCWVRVPAAGDELPVDAWTGATICVRVRFTQPYAYRRIVPSKLGDSYKLFKGYYVEALQQGQKRTSNDLELARVSQPSSLRSHPAAHARAACLRSDARRAGR